MMMMMGAMDGWMGGWSEAVGRPSVDSTFPANEPEVALQEHTPARPPFWGSMLEGKEEGGRVDALAGTGPSLAVTHSVNSPSRLPACHVP
eukprot:scaffold1674_cov340-Prasinococcus_capsulatus_cf.AAC.1